MPHPLLTSNKIWLLFFFASFYSPLTARPTIHVAWEADVRTIDPRHAVDANSQYLEDLIHCSL